MFGSPAVVVGTNRTVLLLAVRVLVDLAVQERVPSKDAVATVDP